MQKKKELENIYASRYDKLKEEIDNKMGQGTFDKLKSSFDRQYLEVLKNKNDFQAYRQFYYSDEIEFLDDWIAEHSEQLVNNDDHRETHDESKLNLVMEYQRQEIKVLNDIIERLQTQMQSTKSDNNGKKEGKSGLDDCMQDGAVRLSMEQEATKVIKETLLGKEKSIDETKHNKRLIEM